MHNIGMFLDRWPSIAQKEGSLSQIIVSIIKTMIMIMIMVVIDIVVVIIITGRPQLARASPTHFSTNIFSQEMI